MEKNPSRSKHRKQILKTSNTKMNLSEISPGKVKDKDCVSDFQNQWWWCLWLFGICLSIHHIIKDKIYLKPKIDYDEVNIKISLRMKRNYDELNIKKKWDPKKIRINLRSTCFKEIVMN